MPDKATTERAKKDLREGKSPSTAAGEFVHEEIEHVRQGKHGARSAQQAVAIGLNKARRAGIPLKPPAKGKTKKSTRKSAERSYEKGQSGQAKKTPRKISRTREKVLQREPRSSASHQALSEQSRTGAHRRTKADRQEAATKAVRTKGATGRKKAARKAARTRAKS